ncbi:MAG: hypothetical protein ABIZ04_21530 [Opitutus sp.]
MARNPKTSAVANWLWLPLLIVVLLLFFLLQKIRAENRSASAEMEALHREAIALRHTIDATALPPSPVAVAAGAAKSKPPKSGGLKSYSDNNVIADPEGGAAVVRRHRRYAMANYREAIDSLQLAPAEKEQLKQLIAEQWIAQTDVRDLLHRQGGTTPELREKMMKTVVQETDQKIRGLLGDDRFAKLQATYDEQTMKRVNWGLFTAAWDAGAPLSDEQQTQVARAMVQVNAEFPSSGSGNETDPTTGITHADVALLELTTSFLSPAQLATIRADQTAIAAYDNAVREAQQRKQSEAGRRTP